MNTKNVTYSDSFGIEHVPKIKKFIGKKKRLLEIFIEYKHIIQ